MCIQRLNYLMEENHIDIDPEYQREIVWKEKNQQELIHTLLDGFPMPALNFCEDSHEQYECMDGKNRLHSIRLFMTNKLTTKDGFYFNDLSKSASNSFMNIQVSICIFRDLSQEDRQDYFRRIQNGVTLNQPELIWSQDDHPLVKEIKKVRTELFDKIKCIWETKRYTDLQLSMNIVNMLNNKCPVLQSTGITQWLNAQSRSENYYELSRKVNLVLIKLHSIISVCPRIHQKLKVPFTLDLAHWIISNDFKIPSIEIISEFIGNIGQLIVDDKNDQNINQLTKKYFTILKNGAASYQYSKKVATARFQLLTELFV